MPIYRLFRNTTLDPEHARVLGSAFEAVLDALGIEDRNDPIAEQIAQKLIELGERGERDPQRLRDFTLMAFPHPNRGAGR